MKLSKYIIIGAAAISMCGCSSTETTNVQNNVTNVTVQNSSAAAPAAPGTVFEIEKELANMTDGQDFAAGYADDSGVWVISRIQVEIKEGRDAGQAAEMANICARKAIAGFLGEEVSASTESSYEEKVVNGKAEFTEYFKSMDATKLNHFLRGVTRYKGSISGDQYSAVYYVTGRMSDASSELQKQLQEAPPGVVRAVGFAVVSGTTMPKARQAAVQSALRNAVEQVMGTTVVGQSQLMDNENAKSKVISQTVGSVEQYRIVKEAQDGINYQVILNAEVDEQGLLDNYAAMVRSLGNPQFYVLCREPDVKLALQDFLTGLGFAVTDRKEDAQFLADANTKYIPVEDNHYGKGLQINLVLNISDKKSGRQLVSLRNVPRLSSTYSGNKEQIRIRCAKAAFKNIKKELHEKLNKLVMDWILNGREVDVVFTNMPADLEEKVAKTVAGVPCANVVTKLKNGSTVTFKCTYVGSSSDFEEFLTKGLKRDLGNAAKNLTTTSIELNSIGFKF